MPRGCISAGIRRATRPYLARSRRRWSICPCARIRGLIRAYIAPSKPRRNVEICPCVNPAMPRGSGFGGGRVCPHEATASTARVKKRPAPSVSVEGATFGWVNVKRGFWGRGVRTSRGPRPVPAELPPQRWRSPASRLAPAVICARGTQRSLSLRKYPPHEIGGCLSAVPIGAWCRGPSVLAVGLLG